MTEDEGEHDRRGLFELVWSEPVNRLAERFGYSDVGFSKLCQKLNIPVPQRGHWARIKAGQSIRPPRLPPPDPTQAAFRLVALSEEDRQKFIGRRRQGAITRRAVAADLALPIPNRLHPLAKATKKRLGQKNGWPSPKRLRTVPTEVLDIEVSEGTLDRAADIASTLLLNLEQLGATVEIDTKKGRTLLHVRGARIGLKISEFVARSLHQTTPAETRAVKLYHDSFRLRSEVPYPQIPQYDFTPTGLLTITASGWPERNWRDTKRTKLEQRIPEVISGIVALAEKVRDRDLEDARKKEAYLHKVEVYQAELKRRSDERAAYLALRAEARKWATATQLRSYIQAQQDAARRDGRLTTELALWLEWAARKADWLDPTILASDAILDAPEPKNPRYW